MTTEARKSGKNGSGFNTPLVFMAVLAVLFFVLALSLFLRGGYQQSYNLQVQEKIYNNEQDPAAALEGEQRAILDEGVRWIDQAAGKVGMPIEDAKDMVVKKGL